MFRTIDRILDWTQFSLSIMLMVLGGMMLRYSMSLPDLDWDKMVTSVLMIVLGYVVLHSENKSPFFYLSPIVGVIIMILYEQFN